MINLILAPKMCAFAHFNVAQNSFTFHIPVGVSLDSQDCEKTRYSIKIRYLKKSAVRFAIFPIVLYILTRVGDKSSFILQ